MQKLSGLPDQIFKYLVAALLVIIPLYPKFPLIRVPGLYVSIRFEDFLMAAVAILTFVKLIPQVKKIFQDGIVRAICLFLLIGLVSLVSGAYLTKTVDFGVGALHLIRRLEYFVPFLAVFAFFPSRSAKNLEFYLKTLMLVVFIAFLYGVGQRYLNFPLIITQNEEYSKGIALRWMPGSHISSTFAGHYDLASFMVLVLPIFISYFFVFKDKISKAVSLIASLSGFWLLVNTISRISFVSYLAAVFSALFLMRKYKAAVMVVIISLILSVFSSSLFARYFRILDVYAQSSELTETNTPVFEDRSTSIRFNVEWPRAIRAFSKNPLLGTGYSSISLATDNDYLRLLGEVGILGFLGFALILLRIFLVFKKALPAESPFVAGVAGGAIGTLINASFIDVFEASKFATIFWLLIAIAVYTIKSNLNEQKI